MAPTNFFFNNFEYVNEQRLVQDLVTEVIQIHGLDCLYVIRNTHAIDTLLDEAAESSFEIAIPLELYINSYEGFTGDGDLLNKFGLNVADQLNLSMSRKRFFEDIGAQFGFERPREGDLVYFPLTNGLFEIKFVEHEATFYQRGSLQYWQMNLEKFNYSSETFNTGIPAIDAVQTNFSMGTDNAYILTQDNYYLVTEDGYSLETQDFDPAKVDPIAQNHTFEDDFKPIADFNEKDPFSENGTFGNVS